MNRRVMWLKVIGGGKEDGNLEDGTVPGFDREYKM
tara:strand:- start:47 stop:151 length:105 start_codon:yes stop_codon:yes gene_type:complete